MRCFISIDVDDETTRDNLMTVTEKLREFDGVKPVKPENFHITLSFLGEVHEDDTDDLRQEFMTVTDNVDVGTFTCKISGVGVFPHMNYISVVWAGAEPEIKINELHMNYTNSMNFTNEQNEGGFVPHTTICRVKYVNSPEKSRLQSLIRECDQEFGAFQVRNVRLKESVLTEEGPEYRDIAVCEL